MSSSECIRELEIDSTLWATCAKIINLLDLNQKNRILKQKIMIILI